jgi:hypothetical protein
MVEDRVKDYDLRNREFRYPCKLGGAHAPRIVHTPGSRVERDLEWIRELGAVDDD